MKLCLMCDLHLPSDKNALQHKILDWTIGDILKKRPDCIICAGDITCDGNRDVFYGFTDKMNSLGIPFLYVPGNSDLRCGCTCDELAKCSSDIVTKLGDTTIFAVNDCNRTISDITFEAIDGASDSDIVFMHHPADALIGDSRTKFENWRSSHPHTGLFFAHLHKSFKDGADISLQALDPDKAIGENPCITYYDTDDDALKNSYYFSPVPVDLYGYFGISCYTPSDQIRFAIENNLKNIELRGNCIQYDVDEIITLIGRWRENGGKDLSVHFPDIEYKDGKIIEYERIDELVDLVNRIGAERITQHVPKVSVKTVNEDKNAILNICRALSERFDSIDHDIVIGVENMHMTSKDTPDDNRRFGYIPEECIYFMNVLSANCRHKVGINFDIGHARNNAPYSQTYQISTWFSMVGKYIVGYHIHQVCLEDNVFENHMPITDIYGKLISFSSFFACWTNGQINKAPVIFEMRPDDAYEITLNTFEKHRQKKYFDIHSHTYYSDCGRDMPRRLADNAVKNGLSILGICDHNYGIGKRKREYHDEIRALASEYKNLVKILCGIEIATFPSLYDIQNPDEIKDYDYCLIEHITAPNSIAGGDLFEFCDKLKIRCGIAHTDLFGYCDTHGYDYEEFFGRMAEKNIFWEMNVSYDSIHNYREHSYVYDFMNDKNKLDIVRKSGVCVSVGFDSHRIEDYNGYRVHSMYDFLKENGIKTFDEYVNENGEIL